MYRFTKTMTRCVIAAMMIAGAAIFPSVASAEWAPAWGTIEQLLLDDNGIQVIIKEPPNPPSKFNSVAERSFHLDKSGPNFAAKAAALTSAFFAGHEVTIDYGGSLTSYYTNVERVKVRPVSP